MRMETRFKVKLYDESKHYDMVREFMLGHGMPPQVVPIKEMLPFLGVMCMDGDLVMGFSFYYRDSIKPIAFKVFQTTNPDISARDAIRALDVMDDYLEFSLKRQGVIALFTMTSNKTILKRAISQGSAQISENEKLLVKELWD